MGIGDWGLGIGDWGLGMIFLNFNLSEISSFIIFLIYRKYVNDMIYFLIKCF